MNFPYDQNPQDDKMEPQMLPTAYRTPLEAWLRTQQTVRDLRYLAKEFDVSADRALELLILYMTWHDMEPIPFFEERDDDG